MRGIRGPAGTRSCAEVATSGEAAHRWSRMVRQRASAALSLLAVVWVLAAASGLEGGTAWAVRVAGLVVSSALVALTMRPDSRGDGTDERVRSQPSQWRHLVARVLLSLGVLVLLVVLLGAVTEVPQVIAPLIAAVVGAHLLVLGGALDQPQYRWAALGLLAAGAAGIGMLIALAPHDLVRVVVGGVAGVSSWVTALRLTLRP